MMAWLRHLLRLVFIVAVLRSAVAWNCTDPEVECVGSGFHGTFALAVAECTETSKCVIMLEGGEYTSTLDLIVDGGPSSDDASIGEVIPYDGQSVLFTKSTGSHCITVNGHNWRIHSGDSGGSMDFRCTDGADEIIRINEVSGIEIKSMKFSPEGWNPYVAVQVISSVPMDGLVLENLEFKKAGSSKFLTAVYFGGGSAPSSTPSHEYGTRISGCRFEEVWNKHIVVQFETRVLIERNYFRMLDMSDPSITFTDSPNTKVYNNIFELKGDDVLPKGVIQYSNTQTLVNIADHEVVHNTFAVDKFPTWGFLCLHSFLAVGDPADPSSFLVANNLFWIGDVTGQTEVVQLQGDPSTMCSEPGTCLNAGAGAFECNRVWVNGTGGPATWQEAPGGWTDGNAVCADGGNGAIAFRRFGDAPIPFYNLAVKIATATNIPSGAYWDTPVDFTGSARSYADGFSLGAVSYVAPFCSESSDCGDTGDCVDFAECVCRNETTLYTGPRCDEPVCNGVGASSGSACPGEQVCIAPGECIVLFCTSDDNCGTYGDCAGNFSMCICHNNSLHTGALCDDPVCNGVPASSGSACAEGQVCVVGECVGGGTTGGDTSGGDNLGLIGGIIGGVATGIVALVFIVVIIFAVVLITLQVRKKQRSAMARRLSSVELDIVGADGETTKHSLNIRPEAFKIKFEDITVPEGKVLGRGGSGAVVKKVSWRGQTMALKVFRLTGDTTQDEMDALMDEALLMEELLHPHIIRYYGATLHLPMIGMMMELCVSDLKGLLVSTRERTGSSLPLREKIRLCKEIASALDFLHSKEIVHRDMKVENVLVDENSSAKVMDFGLSRVLKVSTDVSKTHGIGTSIYMAPEIVRGEDYSNKIDVFSFGILVFLVASENWNPYDNAEFVEYKAANDASHRPDLGQIQGMAALKSLAKRCWSHHPDARPAFAKIVAELQSELESTVLTIYVRATDEDDDAAEDVGLKTLTMASLLEVASQKYPGRQFVGAKCVKDGGQLQPLILDSGIAALEQDALVVVSFGD